MIKNKKVVLEKVDIGLAKVRPFLNSDGGDVKVSDGGTHIGSLSNSSSDFIISSAVSVLVSITDID